MYNSKPEPMTSLGIRLPVWLREYIEEEARKNRRSLSDMIRVILEDYMQAQRNDG